MAALLLRTRSQKENLMNVIVRRKLTTIKIGEKVDLRPDGIPFSVERNANNVFRVIPHDPGGEYSRIRCKSLASCLEKFAVAFEMEGEK